MLGEDGKSIRRERIDLKELEKFGFEEDGDKYFYYGFTEPNSNSEIRMYVDIKTKEISTGFDVYFNPYKIHDKIYDLIQAGLVEKVEENK